MRHVGRSVRTSRRASKIGGIGELAAFACGSPVGRVIGAHVGVLTGNPLAKWRLWMVNREAVVVRYEHRSMFFLGAGDFAFVHTSNPHDRVGMCLNVTVGRDVSR